MSKPNPFRYFKTSAEIIRLAVMMYENGGDKVGHGSGGMNPLRAA